MCSMQTYPGITCHLVSRELLQGPGCCDATILPSSRRLTETSVKIQWQVFSRNIKCSSSLYLKFFSHFIHAQNTKILRIYWFILLTLTWFLTPCLCLSVSILSHTFAVVFAGDRGPFRGCKRPGVAGPPQPHPPAEGQAQLSAHRDENSWKW